MASNKGFKTLIRLVFVRWFKAELKLQNAYEFQSNISNKYGNYWFKQT